MPIISKPCKKHLVIEEFGDFLADNNSPQRHVSRGQPFRSSDDVWYYVPIIDCEPFAGTPPATHHFIRDEQDPILVTNFADARPIIIWRDDQAIRPGHAFHEDCRDLVRTLIFDDLFYMLDTLLATIAGIPTLT